jgi:hypothetical protein
MEYRQLTLAITCPHEAEAKISALGIVNLWRWVRWMAVLGGRAA